jgi:hypothetical protein
MAVDERAAAPAQRRAGLRRGPVRRRGPVLQVVAAVAVLAALTWWVTPERFSGWSSDPYMYGITPPEGEAVWLDTPVNGSRGDVRLLGAWPAVSVGRSADVSLVVCGPGPDSSIGSVYGDEEAVSLCSDRREPPGAVLRGADQLVVRVLPDGAQPVVVDSVRVLYLDGFRPGLQRVGGPLVVQPVDASW